MLWTMRDCTNTNDKCCQYRLNTHSGYSIVVVIFWDFLMFDQIFFSNQVKGNVIISNKYDMCELPNEFPNGLKVQSCKFCKYMVVSTPITNYWKLQISRVNYCKTMNNWKVKYSGLPSNTQTITPHCFFLQDCTPKIYNPRKLGVIRKISKLHRFTA